MKQTYDVMRAQFLLSSDEVKSELFNQEKTLKSRSRAQPSHVVTHQPCKDPSANLAQFDISALQK